MALFNEASDREKNVARRRGLWLLALVNVFVIILILSYASSAWSEIRKTFGWDQKLEIALLGEGKVSAKPDIARISATVMTQATTLAAAQSENSENSNKVTTYLKGAGVAEKDIKTVGYNIFPQYSYPQPCTRDVCPAVDVPRIVGYQVRTTYEFTVRDLLKAGEILTGIVNAGVNEVGNLLFTIENPDALQAEARQKAVDDVRAKADALAKNLGRRVGRIVSFSESGGIPPPVYYGRAEMALDGKGGAGPVSVEPGQNEVVVSVNVTYQFR